jgi:hypothetical protein
MTLFCYSRFAGRSRRSMVGGMTPPLHVSGSGLGRFHDDRVGMVVHWRLHSLPEADEWAMFHDRYFGNEHEIPDRDALVRLAANAGQRHHDGSSRYDTALSDDMMAKAAARSDGLVSTVRLDLS